jgi:predicted RNA binding protein YcfA (HicA-like mRNA interferase family)
MGCAVGHANSVIFEVPPGTLNSVLKQAGLNK